MVNLKQPVNPSSSAVDSTTMLCTVQNVDAGAKIANVIDQLGAARQISMKTFPTKIVAYPAVGEVWIISREFGDWFFAGVMNAPLQQGLVPAGGSTNAVLAKSSGTDYADFWMPSIAAPPNVSTNMIRDSAGRSQIQTPVSANDITNKAYVDGRTGRTFIGFTGTALDITSAGYTVAGQNYYLDCTSTSNPVVTLPTANGNTSSYTFTFEGATGNRGAGFLTIQCQAGETINGSSSFVLYKQWSEFKIVARDSNEWRVDGQGADYPFVTEKTGVGGQLAFTTLPAPGWTKTNWFTGFYSALDVSGNMNGPSDLINLWQVGYVMALAPTYVLQTVWASVNDPSSTMRTYRRRGIDNGSGGITWDSWVPNVTSGQYTYYEQFNFNAQTIAASTTPTNLINLAASTSQNNISLFSPMNTTTGTWTCPLSGVYTLTAFVSTSGASQRSGLLVVDNTAGVRLAHIDATTQNSLTIAPTVWIASGHTINFQYYVASSSATINTGAPIVSYCSILLH